MNRVITPLFARVSLLLACSLLVIAAGSPAAAANLLPNSGFDTNVVGWSPTVNNPATVEWSPADAGGQPGSGSLRLTHRPEVGNSAFAHGPCVSVEGGERYSGTAQFLLAGGTATTGIAFLSVDFFADDHCALPAGEGNSFTVVTVTRSWRSGRGQNVAPANARSARLVAGVAATTAGTLVVGLDNVVFGLTGTVADCASATTGLCVQAARFRVTALWKTPDGSAGAGRAVNLTGDTGYFWFFSDSNVEVVVKVIDACTAPYHRYWVFASGLTNVFVRLEVTDTVTGAQRVYENQQGRSFEPILDTDAFATCP
jgi:hypothetical protein